jgi:hypothetical protein
MKEIILMDRAQIDFIKHCKAHLPDYPLLLKEAKKAAQLARKECRISYQEDNAAKRAGNLILLMALKAKKKQLWRTGKTT